MRPIITAFTTAAAATALLPSGALAGTYDVHWCDAQADYQPPAGPEWSTTQTGGSYNATQPGVSLECSAPIGPSTTLIGAGGWIAGAVAPGSMDTAVFTAPAGTRVVGIAGTRQALAGSGSYAEASIFTLSGRALDDTSSSRAGNQLYEPSGPVSFDAAALGPDGAQGVQWGARCPAALPGGHTQCGGASYGLSGRITLADDSAPSVAISASLSGDTATISAAAADPQSGVQTMQVSKGAALLSDDAGTCDARRARQCSPQTTRSLTFTIAAGHSETITLTARNAAGDETAKTIVVTRPAPGPTPTPPPTQTQPAPQPSSPPPASPPTTPAVVQGSPAQTPSITLATRREGRTIVFSGRAKGCDRVRVAGPRGTTTSAKVKRGRWAAKLRKLAGRYVATCGSARATHRSR